MIVWGIDPGVFGAICCFDYTEGAVDIFDMPIVEVRGKKEVSPVLVRNILRDLPGPVFVERVGARPGQGVSSMFNFGKSYGMVLGVVAALDYSLHYVTPQRWQRDLHVESGKDGSRTRAMQLLPAYSQEFRRRRDDGRADAALIAYWGVSHGLSVESDD